MTKEIQSTNARWYFQGEERQRELWGAVVGWMHTPFRKCGGRQKPMKQVAVDCVHLAASVYIECGFLTEFSPPDYRLDHSLHSDRNMVREYVEATGRFARVHSEPYLPGDLLCFQMGRTEHHTGVFVGRGRFVHVMADFFVMEAPLRDWLKRLTSVYRPLRREK